MRLYHRLGAGRPLRAVWALEEAGIPYEIEMVSKEGESGERHSARHPLGRVPVLEDDGGELLFESSAICLHVAELAPEAGLIAASGTRERALAYQWIFFVMTEIEPPAILAYRAHAAGGDEDEAALRRVDRALGAVEAALAGCDHIIGERFSIADVIVSEVSSMTTRFGVGDPRPGLLPYFERVAARPARERAIAAIDAAIQAA